MSLANVPAGSCRDFRGVLATVRSGLVFAHVRAGGAGSRPWSASSGDSLVVVEQWLSAVRRQSRWHHIRQSGLLAGLLDFRRVASGSGLLSDTAPAAGPARLSTGRVAGRGGVADVPVEAAAAGAAAAGVAASASIRAAANAAASDAFTVSRPMAPVIGPASVMSFISAFTRPEPSTHLMLGTTEPPLQPSCQSR